ncbi:MAG: hypothetical protein HYY23_08330 [Verrucomicrobia bacterium]|nr:hypothetical protein [Verrucomicrobiota bacterium]
MELLVAVSIMSLIVYALYHMFNQTQKALRGSITQVDVLEAGRAALDMIGRELEQVTATGVAGATNLYAGSVFIGSTPAIAPVVQSDLDEQQPLRTNVLQELFFLSRRTNTWVGTGYRVIGAQNGVGTLYRFTVSTNYRFISANNLSGAYFTADPTNRATGLLSTNFHRVADGVIHLRLLAFDPQGRRIGVETTNFFHPQYRVLRQSLRQASLPVGANNVILREDVARQTKLIFLSNALPAYLELEFGVVEPDTLVQYDSMRLASASVAQDFLRKRANKVHLFRQRIPIRTAWP